MAVKVIGGLDGDSQTGLFDLTKDRVFIENIGNGLQVRYKTGYELGFILGSSGVAYDNPFDPMQTESDEFERGLFDGQWEKQDAIKKAEAAKEHKCITTSSR